MPFSFQPLGSRAYLCVGTGNITADDTRSLVEQVEPWLETHHPAAGYNDWLDIRSYEMTARKLLMEFVLRNRTRYRALHVALGRNPLLSMAVSVANITLGSFITVHPTRAEMEAIMNREPREP